MEGWAFFCGRPLCVNEKGGPRPSRRVTRKPVARSCRSVGRVPRARKMKGINERDGGSEACVVDLSDRGVVQGGWRAAKVGISLIPHIRPPHALAPSTSRLAPLTQSTQYMKWRWRVGHVHLHMYPAVDRSTVHRLRTDAVPHVLWGEEGVNNMPFHPHPLPGCQGTR